MKVKYFPYQPHCFAFGGFDHQMLNTLDAVNLANEIAGKLDIWSRDSDFDILHLWGMGEHAFNCIEWSKKSGKSVIATVLIPYFDTLRAQLSYYFRYNSSTATRLRYYYSLLDAVVVLNDQQALVLNRYFKIPNSKISIIPNVVNKSFFEFSGSDFVSKYNIRDYILCTGNICERKNQYNLALACIDLNLDLVLIGNILDGEQRYGRDLANLIQGQKNILWIRELPNNSVEYLSAFSNCRVFALPSSNETQPISALEAVAMNKNLLLQKKGYADQKYYLNAALCNSGSVNDVKEGLKGIIAQNNIPNPYIYECLAENIGLRYNELYLKVAKLENALV